MIKSEKYTTSSVAQTQEIFAALAVKCVAHTVITLSGDLGAGKTSGIQAFLRTLGIEGPYTSPTFAIIEEYVAPAGSACHARGIHRIYHIDAYRSDAENMQRLGWDEMVSDPQGIVIVEWPEKIESLLPSDLLRVEISHAGGNQREICVSEG